MKHLFTFFAFLFFLAACTKQNNLRFQSPSRQQYFSNNASLLTKVQTVLAQHSPGEKVKAIDNIFYFDSKDKSYAFIFYRSDHGANNVVIEQDFLDGDKLTASTLSCKGETCDCKVMAGLSSSGSFTFNCSCSKCTMLKTQHAIQVTHDIPKIGDNDETLQQPDTTP